MRTGAMDVKAGDGRVLRIFRGMELDVKTDCGHWICGVFHSLERDVDGVLVVHLRKAMFLGRRFRSLVVKMEHIVSVVSADVPCRLEAVS